MNALTPQFKAIITIVLMVGLSIILAGCATNEYDAQIRVAQANAIAEAAKSGMFATKVACSGPCEIAFADPQALSSSLKAMDYTDQNEAIIGVANSSAISWLGGIGLGAVIMSGLEDIAGDTNISAGDNASITNDQTVLTNTSLKSGGDMAGGDVTRAGDNGTVSRTDTNGGQLGDDYREQYRDQNSNQGNPVNNSDNRVDNSNQGNPVDNSVQDSYNTSTTETTTPPI